MNEGWKCPNCGKAHAPQVLTCPEPGTGLDPTPIYPAIIGPAWPRPDVYIGDPLETHGVGTWCMDSASTIFARST